MGGLMLAFQTGQVAGIDMNTFVSVTVLVALVGATARLSSLLTKIETKLERLRHLPAQVDHMEMHLVSSEEDLNNLFAAVRAQADPARLADFMRRTRYLPYRKPEE